MPFTLGQRWISDTESELGLGTVVASMRAWLPSSSLPPVKTACTLAMTPLLPA
jgi:hypothetical protein